ncbi:hypothetical protein TNCV_3164001 [Trichonephila clavipes]|nr:hypothetical protein TNCV_3164001 [Trichonephila clavipes]
MAAPLMICTMEERRTVIRFLLEEEMKSSEINRRMQVQYGNRNALAKFQVCISVLVMPFEVDLGKNGRLFLG